ncbi:helicase, partial [Beet yellow stunt virus]
SSFLCVVDWLRSQYCFISNKYFKSVGDSVYFKAVPTTINYKRRPTLDSIFEVHVNHNREVQRLKNFLEEGLGFINENEGSSGSASVGEEDNFEEAETDKMDDRESEGTSSTRANFVNDVAEGLKIERAQRSGHDVSLELKADRICKYGYDKFERDFSRKKTLVSKFLNLVNTENAFPEPMIIEAHDLASNSVREFYYLQELTLFEIFNKLNRYFSELEVVEFDRKICRAGDDARLLVYRESDASLYGKDGRRPLKDMEEYEFVFRTGGLLPNDKEFSGNKLFHANTKFIAANSFLRSNSSYRNFIFENDSCRIRLYEAPPGGGKTHTLIASFVKMHKKNRILVLTANKSSQVEILKKINDSLKREHETKTKLLKFASKAERENYPSADSNVYTIDSYLMNHLGTKCDVLFVDECFMVHAGAVTAVSNTLVPRSVFFVGDSRQIHHIERNEYDVASFSDLDRLVAAKDRIYGQVSYRCPWDVCGWLSKHYPNTVATTNVESEGKSSLTITEINSVDDVVASKRNTYLTFLQSEKKELEKHLAKKGVKATVKTVHEAQGDTYRDVVLVRTKFQEDAPFSSFNHINVAITRHTESLTYAVLAARRNDNIAAAICEANELVDKFRLTPHSFGGSVLNIDVEPVYTDNSRCKASSAPINSINDFLEDVVPGSTSLNFGDTSAEMESQPFESGANNVTVRDSAKPGSGTDHDEQRV